jgi:peptidyl-prolyl cis-trans isomerase B (cyclophilin B)
MMARRTVGASVSIVAAIALVDAVPTQLPVITDPLDAIAEAGSVVVRERYYSDGLRWRPLFAMGQGLGLGGLSPAMQILDQARFATTHDLRAAFVRVVGRLENPADVPALIAFLGDGSSAVRTEAVNAIVQALHVPDAPGRADGSALAFRAFRELVQFDGGTRGAALEALGELPLNDRDLRDVERILTTTLATTLDKKSEAPAFVRDEMGSLRGLVALIRNNRGHALAGATRDVLRRKANPGFGGKPNALALEALVLAGDRDVNVARAAATYRCVAPPARSNVGLECGWEIRRLGLQLMAAPVTALHSALLGALNDAAFRVRIEALRVYARDPATPKSCRTFMDALADRVHHVAIEAMTLLDPECTEHEEAADRLQDAAQVLADAYKTDAWPTASAALTALARFRRDAAGKIAHELAGVHPQWQVRADAAKLAVVLGDEPLALELMRDKEPNVRTEALQALHRLGSPATVNAIAGALDDADHQLVYAAAVLLKQHAVAVPALMPSIARTLDRMTRASQEPPQDVSSREARLELLNRIREQGLSGDTERIENLRVLRQREFDPIVHKAMADTLSAMTGTKEPDVPPVAVEEAWPITKPEQSSACYQVDMADGSWFTIRLNRTGAPDATRAFVGAQQHGYYDGLTFHRINPMSFAEGGSPAANYYTGRGFLLDELGGARHTRGTVGMSRHDRHTGDLQFFIDLVDNPAFNREFTVLGAVAACRPADPDTEEMLRLLDNLRPGDAIRRITPVLPSPGPPPREP